MAGSVLCWSDYPLQKHIAGSGDEGVRKDSSMTLAVTVSVSMVMAYSRRIRHVQCMEVYSKTCLSNMVDLMDEEDPSVDSYQCKGGRKYWQNQRPFDTIYDLFSKQDERG